MTYSNRITATRSKVQGTLSLHEVLADTPLHSFAASMLVRSSKNPVDHIVVGLDPNKLQNFNQQR